MQKNHGLRLASPSLDFAYFGLARAGTDTSWSERKGRSFGPDDAGCPASPSRNRGLQVSKQTALRLS